MDHQLDTLFRLDTRLRTLILRAIIVRWHAGEHDISSHDLYCQLLADGVYVGAGAMAGVFNNLRELRLIGGSLPWNTTATDLDGDIRITWVNPCLLVRPDDRNDDDQTDFNEPWLHPFHKLVAYAAGKLEANIVSRAVNNLVNENVELMQAKLHVELSYQQHKRFHAIIPISRF